MAAYVALLQWSPRAEDYAVVYILAALFGIGGAINSPLVSGYYHYFDILFNETFLSVVQSKKNNNNNI
jgi:hypothetical protein